jgi:hypothetical protein
VSCAGTSDCVCGCCSGTSVQTPQGESNLPGLPAIVYRTGSWATFRESMLARLSSADYPALAGLKTRDSDDFSIALLDAGSVMLDILTFYQERLANESYLRTATQLQSLTELARLIGYQPAPGVGSSVYLSFSLSSAPGSPTDPTTQAITIPKDTQVQSVPAQNQTPQTFETSTEILAKSDWNALPVQTGIPWTPTAGAVSAYLQGNATQLQPGDAILIVGDDHSGSQWDLRIVTSIQADTSKGRTYVMWSDPLASGGSEASKNPKFYALRQRASLFGYNAVNPLMLTRAVRWHLRDLLDSSTHDWLFNSSDLVTDSLIDLDAVYSKLAVDGWLVLILPDATASGSPAGIITLYRIQSVTSISRSDYSISAKITRVKVDSQHNIASYYYGTRDSSVLAQSEELQAAEQPLTYPLYGSLLDLQGVRVDLAAVQAVAIYGKRQKLQVNAGVNDITFVADDGSKKITLKPGDVITLLKPRELPLDSDGTIPNWTTFTGKLALRVLDPSGRAGTLGAAVSHFTLFPASSKDPVVQEFALVSSVSVQTIPYPRTRIHLSAELQNCYDRTATTVNANVGLATQGMSVTEILGSGQAYTPNQKFSLKQTPLTFVQAPTPTGRLSTLEVKANSVAWKEMSSLYEQDASAQVFATLNQPNGSTDIHFGDGVEGATLPTGQNNIQASYRIGSGLSGNVGAGSITTLIDRPLGVSGVNNPSSATGGQDPQSVNDIRSNAPLSVLTLGRAVSITDYQNFAQSFAGIAKAYAIWIPCGPGRGVFVTVAAAGGSALPLGNPTLGNLVSALRDYGNPLIPITAVSFLETFFNFSADIKYDPAYDAAAVKASVLGQLRQSYSFSARSFGQGVSVDEIEAFIQGVPGVIAVNVTNFTLGPTSNAGDLASEGWSVSAHNDWLVGQVTLERPHPPTPTRICPYLPIASTDAPIYAAEILVLDPNPKNVMLGVLP